MGKYENIEKNVFSVFAQSTWVTEDIKTYPANVQAMNTGEEFVRVSILPDGYGINPNSTSGVVIIDIFTSAGKGPNRATLIADKLDSYLVGKSLSTEAGTRTQFFGSALSHDGLDSENRTLHRSTYTIRFSYFGVF